MAFLSDKAIIKGCKIPEFKTWLKRIVSKWKQSINLYNKGTKILKGKRENK